jgi:hypothetical protein
MPTAAEPLWPLRDAKLENACRQYREGNWSEAVFKASLYALGLRGRDIETEVNLNYPKRK